MGKQKHERYYIKPFTTNNSINNQIRVRCITNFHFHKYLNRKQNMYIQLEVLNFEMIRTLPYSIFGITIYKELESGFTAFIPYYDSGYVKYLEYKFGKLEHMSKCFCVWGCVSVYICGIIRIISILHILTSLNEYILFSFEF